MQWREQRCRNRADTTGINKASRKLSTAIDASWRLRRYAEVQLQVGLARYKHTRFDKHSAFAEAKLCPASCKASQVNRCIAAGLAQHN